MPFNVTIAITRYAEPDDLVTQALSGAVAQAGVTGEVLFIDQDERHPLAFAGLPAGNLELRQICRKLRGLSHARNVAIELAKHPVVLFLDADAIPDMDWAKNLAAALAKNDVAVAGSRIEPGWQVPPPAFTRARVLRDQYSLLELGNGIVPVARVVGAGFGIDAGKLPAGLLFNEALGRRNGRLFGGEESEFCARVRALGFGIVYVGDARVTHIVSAERLRLGWILKRMVYAGYSRAKIGGGPRPSQKLCRVDYLFAPLYLPPYIVGWLWGKFA